MHGGTNDAGQSREGEDRAPLLLLPGVGADCRMFEPMLDRLGDRVEAIGWNLPGYGGRPVVGPYDFADLARQIIDTLDARAIPRAVVLGHSLGGMLAQELAATRPERVAALILSGTTAAFGSRDGTFQEAYLSARLAPLDRGFGMAVLAARASLELVGRDADPAIRATATRLMAEIPEQSYRAALACLARFDRREDLARITAPTLLIAGEDDTTAPVKTMRRMAAAIPGARLEVLPATGHLAPLERPEIFAGLVRGFLAQLVTVGR